MSSNNNKINDGIFINQISESQGELQQPSIKRQRIEGSNEQHPAKTAPTPQVPKSLAFLDDSGNSTSSSSSSPSPVHESENILKADENDPIEKDDEQLLLSEKECLATFQIHLVQHQCLCGLSERTLKIPFQYYSVKRPIGKKQTFNRSEYVESDTKKNETQVHYIKSLKRWPEDYLLKFLSNLQLVFHIYLKQNAKGNICGEIMRVCEYLIQNEIHIFEELIELCNSTECSNSFISFVSSKVITYFLIIIKDEIDQEWLKKIVDNLFTFDHLDFLAVKRINFSLDIIKCIVEWKDHDEHLLEEESNGFSILNPPSLETNYFATFHHDQSGPSTSSSSALPSYLTSHATNSGRSSATSGHNSPVSNGCHFVQLTDSESFDTAHIKGITTKILANKWPALVKNISSLIIQISRSNARQPINRSSASFNNAENCILKFIALWESIISVKTNLSVIETLPFTAHLVNFESRLNQNLPCTIYKQMLQLFNEALCYGSTLALQDLLPDETCSLAHKIVNHVKDSRILESMPRQINSTNDSDDNLKTFIGLDCESVIFSPHSFDNRCTSTSINNQASVTFDKSLLQKMTLLVLKSVAVSVKECRSDSSDSSVDSANSEALAEMILIERSMRDVLNKLESFIKNTLEFHPESHFSKILIHLFDDQDDFLIEAMVCTLDVTSGISFRNNALPDALHNPVYTFPELVAMLNPVYTFLEFLKIISNDPGPLLDLLISNETCFLLYFLRILKYIKNNWSMFLQSCRDCGMGNNVLDDTMELMTRLRFKIGRLVSQNLYPYDIAPILRLLESCENLYEGSELS